MVILGANAFYELPSADMQERCVRFTREALVPGGRLFVDNDDYKGDWGKGPFGEKRVVFEGRDTNGTFGLWTSEALSFDEELGVLHMKRTWLTHAPDGSQSYTE